MHKRIISLLLAAVLLLGLSLPVRATEEETTEVQTELRHISVSTAENLLALAADCRLDSYSLGLVVTLEQDIDLTGVEFTPIAIFSGSFQGDGHAITGLDLSADGSVQGLFRYLTETAVVENLTVQGDIHPGGSRNSIGGIAGENRGQIRGCTFAGNLSGSDYVGGIAGRNAVTGLIENCIVEGELHGDHFVGGVTGENSGVIRGCTNRAAINTTPQQNTVDISDITMDTLTNSEAVNTVTDIGGVAGLSTGVIRACENHGDVGYKHMGYNIGGIAGTQSGYLADCRNYGSIQGRKEVGGIVGQMEPVALIEFSEDTLQILKEQLGGMTALVGQAAGNAYANAGQVSAQMGLLQNQAQSAKDAVDYLVPDLRDPTLPDLDGILAAQGTLSSNLTAMPNTMNSIAAATQNTVNTLGRDLQAVSGQIGAMGQTINQGAENLGITVEDCSDLDTAEDLTGKAEGCVNYGDVLADLNAGGIAGAMAVENDLDLLENWESYGEESLNVTSKVRAVILACENHGTVVGKKQNVGGIVGWQSMGLVRAGVSTGAVDGSGADYVGGISGMSSGFIRNCFVKCPVSGDTYVGGVAGSGTVVTDCLTMVRFTGTREKLGAVLGAEGQALTEVENPIAGNFYLSVEADPGAIDGVSYEGMARMLPLNEFLALEALPELFRTVNIRFRFPDGSLTEIPLVPGQSLELSQIPSVPEQAGSAGQWAGLTEEDLTEILFDRTYEAAYTAYSTTIASDRTREDGRPLLLVEGAFTPDAAVTVEGSSVSYVPEEGASVVECWSVTMTEPGHTGRFHLPEGGRAEELTLMICAEDGQWRNAEARAEGSYLVFGLEAGDRELALIRTAGPDNALILVAAASSVVTAAVVLLLTAIRRKTKKTAA